MCSVVCISHSVCPHGGTHVTITHDTLDLTVSKLFQLTQMSIKAQNDSSNTFNCKGCSNNIQQTSTGTEFNKFYKSNDA